MLSRTLITLAILLLPGCGAESSALDGLQPAQTLQQYQMLSTQLRALDDTAINAELKHAGLSKVLEASHSKYFGFDVKMATQDAGFIAGDTGRQLAETILSYQTPSGGWSKRTDMGGAPRQPGQQFGVEKNYIPTFDNHATSTQFWVMVNACNAIGDARYCKSAERTLQFIMLAQYPNGGWPQTFPLRGKYHDDITFNDTVVTNLMKIIAAVVHKDERLKFIPQKLQIQAQGSLKRGLQMLLATQIKSDGVITIWGAQHHPQTLAPTAARAFEPVAMATSESADLLLFLMTLESPSESIKRSIHSGSQWFAAHQIRGYRWEKSGRQYAELIEDQAAGPIWARFYEIGSNRPVFGDRDGAVYYDVDKVSVERRSGYGWYTENPNKVLKAFAKWQTKHR